MPFSSCRGLYRSCHPKAQTPKKFVPKSVQRENLHNKTGKILTGNVDEHHASSRPWVSSAFWTVRRPFLDALPLSVMGSWTKRWLLTADSMNEALPKNHLSKKGLSGLLNFNLFGEQHNATFSPTD